MSQKREKTKLFGEKFEEKQNKAEYLNKIWVNVTRFVYCAPKCKAH